MKWTLSISFQIKRILFYFNDQRCKIKTLCHQPWNLKISPYVHFMVQILFLESNSLQSVTSLKIDSLYTIRSVIFMCAEKMRDRDSEIPGGGLSDQRVNNSPDQATESGPSSKVTFSRRSSSYNGCGLCGSVLMAELTSDLAKAVDGLGICFAFLLCVLRVETGYVLPRFLFVCFGFIFIICLFENFESAPDLLIHMC